MTVTRSLEAGGVGSRASSCDGLSMLEKHWGAARVVHVHRQDNTSLGISIVGGKVDLCQSGTTSESLLGIFVKNVVTDSPAGRTGHFKTGDRILEVGGINLRQASHEKAVEAIRNSDNPVTFLVQSLIPWPSENEINAEKKSVGGSPCKSPADIYATPRKLTQSPSNDSKGSQDVLMTPDNKFGSSENISKSPERGTPTSGQILMNDVQSKIEPNLPDADKLDEKVDPSANEKSTVVSVSSPAKTPVDESSESEDEDDEEDTRELEGKTHSEKGEEIDRASAAALKRSKEEIAADPEEEDDFGYTNNKVKKKYAALGHTVLMVQLERTAQGLGLSLAGHRDRNCMAVFVCGLNPAGAAHRTGAIHVGDEILEVNGIVLHGRCHLNASAIIKGLSGPIFKVIVLRRKTALEDIAVKPITQFPVSLAEETPEEKYSNYPNVRVISIKKGSHSLGIMIIEGRHAEVGQGIFISDIQEGSAAEKAGLDIGEMILAVNTDTLLGASYDSAASLLKRTEGVVTLVLSNPNKRTPSPAPGLEVTAVNDDKPGHLTPKRATPTPTLRTSAPPSRPTTPVASEPVSDPATCAIVPGKEVTIEISTDNKSLGLAFVGGKDTLVQGGIVVLEVFPDGAAGRDGRLQPGDQLLDVNGTPLLDVTHTNASAAIRQILPKFKVLVHRPEKVELTTVDVELTKKAGKGLGLSVIARKNGTGVYISEILNGSNADVDGRLMKGDIIVSVNDQKVDSMSSELVAALLKTVAGRVSLKLNRHKPQIR